jgi:hypothetical protein
MISLTSINYQRFTQKRDVHPRRWTFLRLHWLLHSLESCSAGLAIPGHICLVEATSKGYTPQFLWLYIWYSNRMYLLFRIGGKKTLRRAMMWILYNCVINEETYCYQWSFGLRWRNKRFKSTGWIQTCTVLKFWPQVRNNNTCIPWLFCEVSWYEDFYQCEGPSQSSMFNGFLHRKPSIRGT